MRFNIAFPATGQKRRFRPQLDPERFDDPLRHLVLKSEYVSEVAIVTFRPQMSAGGCINELGCDPDTAAGTADRSFEHRHHTELAPHCPNVGTLVLVSKARITRNYHEPRNLGKVGNDVFGDAVGEILLLRV